MAGEAAVQTRVAGRRAKAADTEGPQAVAPNLLDQIFDIPTPWMAWGTDITYIPTDEWWLYLAGVKDFGSREIVGFAMGSRMMKN